MMSNELRGILPHSTSCCKIKDTHHVLSLAQV
jgi:hypothetical protein